MIFRETFAVNIRTNNAIRGVEGGGQEHKLLLYADDILAVYTDPVMSLPHLMDTIQSFSKLSGYTINWNKSEAMPLSASCYSYMVERFKFKWVPKGMKYLGIRLCRDMGELPLLNFNPVLQKNQSQFRKVGEDEINPVGKTSVDSLN